MPTYTYTARDGNGTASSGIVAANSVTEVTQILRRDGKYPIRIELVAAWRGGALNWQTVSVVSDGSFAKDVP